MPFILAAGAAPPFFVEVAALMVAGAAIAYVCQRLGLMPIVGFLVAGVVIGPHALGLVRNQDLVDAAAEVGVILLLFTIGIEFSLEKLSRIKKVVLVGGGLQVGGTVLVVMLLLMLAGIDVRFGIFTGFLVAMSSTTIMIKVLAERGEVDSVPGQVSLGVSLFQDLASVAMILMLPILAGTGGAAIDIFWTLAKALGLIALVLVLARRIMPPLLEVVARTCSPELFLLTIVAICFSFALVASLSGVSLSLGAFLAGIIVSESRFSEHAMGEILPLQILFSATFFVSVGMLLDLSFLVQNLPLVLACIAAVLIIKVLTTAPSILALGYKLPVAATASILLAQVGEFSFVLERAGREAGLFPAGMGEAGSQAFIASTVLLMGIAPFLAQLGTKLTRRLELRQAEAAPPVPEVVPEERINLEDHVIVAGYGPAARKLVRVLAGSRIPFVITTLSPGGALEAEEEGLPVLRGDASKMHLLDRAGLDRAKMIVVADDEPDMARRITALARNANPTVRILVRTRALAAARALRAAGADRVISDELESIVQLFADVLRDYRIAPEEIEAHVAALRGHDYAALNETAPAAPVAVCEGLDRDGLSTRTVSVRDGTVAAGRSLAGLTRESGFEITLRTLRRNGRPVPDLTPETILRPGDELVLSGSAAAFARAASLFGPDPHQTTPRPPSSGNETERDDTPLPVFRDTMTTNIDTESTVVFQPRARGAMCPHLDQIHPVLPSAKGCQECLATGDAWVHLRLCMNCGHVGCCDSSKNKHARKHYHHTGHPIIRSLEPGESWGWCFEDQVIL